MLPVFFLVEAINFYKGKTIGFGFDELRNRNKMESFGDFPLIKSKFTATSSPVPQRYKTYLKLF